MTAYTYILKCSDGSFYTGWTTDLQKRVAVHNSGRGAKYTRSRLPVCLMYWEEFEEQSAARRREAEIKSYSRDKKIEIMHSI